jgi:hypothetical protein
MASRQDYDTAILFSRTRLQMNDVELLEGAVETVGASQIPWGNQGGFAVVYKFRTKGGKARALRCFTRPIDPNIKQRYELMGPYFRQYARGITADFTYYERGILVKETMQGQSRETVYPVIDMEWVEGLTLFDSLEKVCKARDRVVLGNLVTQWVGVLQQLRQARMAHGDLSAINVMVRKDGRLVLVDYDGVYIQQFAAMNQLLYGTRGFQHPQMAKRAFDEWMDEFSGLLIYTALLALQAQPELWNKYTKRGTTGRALDQTLLFTGDDLEDPQQSALFAELARSPDARVRAAVQELKRACGQAVEQVRFPMGLIDPEFAQKSALEALKQAVAQGDDEQIMQVWGAGLEQYAPAQQYRPEVERARMRLRALERFRKALQSGLLREVLASYDPGLLNPCKGVTQAEREQLALAQGLNQALAADTDEAILKAWMAIEQSPHKGFLLLAPSEQQRLNAAQQFKVVLEGFRQALKSRSLQQIVRAYDRRLETAPEVTPEERQIAGRALAFFQACQADDDDKIEDAAAAITSIAAYRQALLFSKEEEGRVQLALQRKDAIKKFRQGMLSRRADQIAASYERRVLDTCKSITQEEREKFRLAEGWADAWGSDKDERLVRAWEAIQRSVYAAFFVFSPAEEDRVELARRRLGALEGLRQALREKWTAPIVEAAAQPVLKQYGGVTQEEWAVIERAQAFQQAAQAEDDVAIEEAARKIMDIHTFRQALSFTPAEQQQVMIAQRRVQALHRFWTALRGKNAQQIVQSYDGYWLGDCKNVTQADREKLERAGRFQRMAEQVREALRKNDGRQVGAVYDEALAAEFTGFTPEEQQQIAATKSWGQLALALDQNAYALAIRVSREIEKAQGGKPIDDFRLRMAKRMFIKKCYPRDVEVRRVGSQVQVQWRWPLSDLVDAVVVAWRFDRFPRDPEDVPQEVLHSNRHDAPRGSGGPDQLGAYSIPCGAAPVVYVLVCAAIMDADAFRRVPVWYYSDGAEASVRQMVGV